MNRFSPSRHTPMLSRLSASVSTPVALCAAAFLFAVAALLPQPANAQWVSTKELVDTYCDSDDPEQAAFCVGYVAGALHVLMAPPEAMPQGRFCIDVDAQPKLSAIAERLIVLRKEQPDIEATPAFSVIAAIIERGFPCPDGLDDATAMPSAPAQAPAVVEDPSTPSDLFGLPASE